jgi:hypothetical protein
MQQSLISGYEFGIVHERGCHDESVGGIVMKSDQFEGANGYRTIQRQFNDA